MLLEREQGCDHIPTEQDCGKYIQGKTKSPSAAEASIYLFACRIPNVIYFYTHSSLIQTRPIPTDPLRAFNGKPPQEVLNLHQFQ